MRSQTIGLDMQLYGLTGGNGLETVRQEMNMLLEDMPDEEEKERILSMQKTFSDEVDGFGTNDDAETAHFDSDLLFLILGDMIKHSDKSAKIALWSFFDRLKKNTDDTGMVLVEIKTVVEMLYEWKRIRALLRVSSIFAELDFFADHDVIPDEKFFEELRLMHHDLASHPKIQKAIDKRMQSASMLAGV